MNYPLYILLGILPSLVWLIFYLHKDSHPEPKPMVLKIFFWGALMGPVAILCQFFLQWIISPTLDLTQFLRDIGNDQRLFFLNILLFAPLTEEFLKYAVVRRKILNNPAFDEPVDAMLYLVISALGFAALENIISILTIPELSLQTAFSSALARFLSATFLHTLASAILGFFVAQSLFNLKSRKIIFWQGFFLAVAFHSFYNYLSSLLYSNKLFAFAIASFLILMSLFVTWQFYRLKKQIAVCRIK